MATTTQIRKPRIIVPRASRGNEILAILFIAAGLLLALYDLAAFYPNDPIVELSGTSADTELGRLDRRECRRDWFSVYRSRCVRLLPLLLFAAAWRRFRPSTGFKSWMRIVGIVVLVVAAAGLLRSRKCVRCSMEACKPAGYSARSLRRDRQRAE